MAAAMLSLASLLLLVPSALAQGSILSQLQSSDFTGFLRLLEHADLIPEIENVIASGRPVSLLCPTDDALMTRVSPTLIAFLKLSENKATLRKVLRAHVLPGRLSPFDWEGRHETLEEGSPVKLALDSDAFYVNDVAVMQYNALVTPEASVHSIPTLIIPAGVAVGGVASVVERSTDSRRVLQGWADAMAPTAQAPAPAPGPISGPMGPAGPAPNAAAPARAVAAAAAFTAAAALLLSLAL